MKIPRIAYLAAMLTLPSVVSASNLGKDPLDHDCTGWMIFSDLNGRNTSSLHKGCDAHPRHVTVLQSGVAKTKFRSIVIVNARLSE